MILSGDRPEWMVYAALGLSLGPPNELQCRVDPRIPLIGNFE